VSCAVGRKVSASFRVDRGCCGVSAAVTRSPASRRLDLCHQAFSSSLKGGSRINKEVSFSKGDTRNNPMTHEAVGRDIWMLLMLTGVNYYGSIYTPLTWIVPKTVTPCNICVRPLSRVLLEKTVVAQLVKKFLWPLRNPKFHCLSGTGIALSVYRWATSWKAGVRFPTGTIYFSLLHSIQTGSGARPASYPMGSGGSSSVEVKNSRAIPPLPHIFSWH
jgi:hypothetical protein